MQDEKTQEFVPTRLRLLAEIETFLKNNPSITAEGFGWNACRNTNLVQRLRKGGDTSTTNLDKVLAYLADPHQSRKSYAVKRTRIIKPE